MLTSSPAAMAAGPRVPDEAAALNFDSGELRKYAGGTDTLPNL